MALKGDETEDLLSGVEYDYQQLKQMEAFGKDMMKEMNSRLIDKFEALVSKQPKKPFVIYEDNIYTYEMMEDMACRVANIAKAWGLKPCDCVAIMIQNEPSFIYTFLGLQKLGICVALVNNNLTSHPLIHSVLAVDCKALIVGSGNELLEAVTDVLPELGQLPVYVQGVGHQSLPPGVKSFDALMQETFPLAVSPAVRSELKLTDTCCYIYTSGTTGNPKPVFISHAKAITLSTICRHVINYGPDDITYIVLPLYHSTGMYLGFGAALMEGSCVALRKKFSATYFWSDCRKYKVTVVAYIGELMRYLLSQPESELDGVHNLRAIIGAGLRADIWHKVQERFKIPKISEFFGATEGYAAFFNFAGKPGAIGRLSPLLSKFDADKRVLVKFDVATAQPIRNEKGHCIPVKIGEPGLLLSKVPEHLKKQKLYKASLEETEKKLVRDVFVPGDSYMNYGDAFVLDKEYFLYFHDRLGDTYRWKGENVSTKEVANEICMLPFIEDANVYGVKMPDHDGKAGMAAITLSANAKLGNKELKELYSHILKELPFYARPLFVRLLPAAVITGTFKNKKVDLAKESYDLTKVKDPLFFLDHNKKAYSPLTKNNLAQFIKSKL